MQVQECIKDDMNLHHSGSYVSPASICRAPIGQGYGLTETCAGAAFSEADDISVGRVGPPLPCCYIKVYFLYALKILALKRNNFFLELAFCSCSISGVIFHLLLILYLICCFSKLLENLTVSFKVSSETVFALFACVRILKANLFWKENQSVLLALKMVLL